MSDFQMILGQSEAAREISLFGRRAAAVDAPVLLTGESGTGKGLLARAIHSGSPRAAKQFISVNCAGIPESLFESEFFGHNRGAFTGAHDSRRGLFEQAHGGTLFLDEVGELPLTLQAKLLTAIEDGEIRRLGAERTSRVNVRLIAATGVDLEDAVSRGLFRRDLYHRLLVLSFRLPALRRREGDIDYLARHFLEIFRHKYRRPVYGFEPGAITRLREYTWPGNIRELAHAIEAAVLACEHPRIRVQNLPRNILLAESTNGSSMHSHHHDRPPEGVQPTPSRRYSFYGPPEEERRRILDTLRQHHGNKTRTAAALGMARNTLRQKLRAHGIEQPGR